MNPNRDDFDAVWALVLASEKMAIIGSHLKQDAALGRYFTQEQFDEAYDERNLAMAKVMEMLGERHV